MIGCCESCQQGGARGILGKLFGLGDAGDDSSFDPFANLAGETAQTQTIASQAGVTASSEAAAPTVAYGSGYTAPNVSSDAGGSSWLPGFGSGLAQGFVTSLNQILSPVRPNAPTSFFGTFGATPFLIGGGILLVALLARKKRPTYYAPSPAAPASSP